MNVLDYLATEFASFADEPFNPVDSAALSQFCMVRAEGVVPPLKERSLFADLGTVVQNLIAPVTNGRSRSSAGFRDFLQAERYADMFTGLVPGRVKENMLALAASPRFRTMEVRDYLSLFDTERQTQFAAMTFVQGREFAYVGFRGTDSSLTGWRENFNMAYSSPVPAQDQAVRYLEAVAKRTPKRLFVGGHSKGGNLAEYAAVKASPEVQARIERVYIHDGPGFKEGALSPDDYEPMMDRLYKTVPQDSVIGLLMHSPVPLRVVQSTAKGIDQHSLFTWEVEGCDFVYADGLTDNARMVSDILREWVDRFDDTQKAAVVDAFFRAIEAAGAHDALELISGGPRAVTLFYDAARNTQGPDRDTLIEAARMLAEVTAGHIGRTVAELLPLPRG